jgi:hypothetical protein
MRRRDYDEDEPVSTTSGMAVASLVLGILSFCTSALTGLPAMLLGLIGLFAISGSGGRLRGKGFAVAGLITGFLGTALGVAVVVVVWMFAVPAFQDAQHKVQSSRNLHQIGIAMHNYHDANNQWVPPYTLTKAGKPGLSWRVMLLPYVEQDHLYRQFRLDEPWDSEHNKRLLSQMPKVYATPGSPSTDPTLTHYQVFVGKGTAFEPGTRVHFGSMQDGTSNTIAVVEAAKPVPWTAPDDILFGPEHPLPELGVGRRDPVVVMCDGGFRQIKKSISPTTLRALVTRNGGEVVSDF